jgi:hypothetical protein
MRSLLQIRFELTASGVPEAEGMTATKADVFGPLASNPVDGEEVAKHYAGQWVPDHRERSLWLEKRVTASARVFSCFRSLFHNMDAMAEESASVVNSLLEFVMAGIGVAG